MKTSLPWLLLSVASAVLVYLLASCLGGSSTLPLGDRCQSDDECESTLVCRYGRCRTACFYDSDCPEGEFCVVSEPSPLEMVCTLEGEGTEVPCPEPLDRPEPGEPCRFPCDVDADCGTDQRCVDNFCYEDVGEDVDGMVAYYRFDGDATDAINGYDGNPTPAVFYDQDVRQSGMAARFDGNSAYIALPFALSAELMQDISIAFWIRSEQVPDDVESSYGSNDCAQYDTLWITGNGVVDADMCGSTLGDWGIALMKDGLLGMISTCSNTPITDRAWHLIVMTRHRDSGDCFLYIDGTEELRADCNGGEDYSGLLQIGVGNNSCDLSGDQGFFEGHIDELRFWNRVLTLEEVQGME